MTDSRLSSNFPTVSILSPRLGDILNMSWHGPHPEIDDIKCPLRNYSTQNAYKLFILKDDINFVERDVSFISEEHARLLIKRDELKKQHNTHAQIKEINATIENGKVLGKEILFKVGREDDASWVVPANEGTLATLTTAFDLAVLNGRHISVKIDPYTHNTHILNAHCPSHVSSLRM